MRHHGDVARIELAAEQMPRWMDAAALRRLRVAVKEAGFARVAIDLGGFRSGSLNVLGGVTTA